MAHSSKLSRFRTSSLLPISLILLLSTLGASPLGADACAPLLSGVTSASRTGSIALTGVSGGGSVNSSAITGASGNWNGGCSGYDNPTFGGSGSGGMAVDVIFYAGTDASNGISCNGKCACTDVQITSGAVSGATVRMFERQGNGVSCTGSQTEVLTHELGHVLGLGESSCSGRIMGDVFGSIASADCTAVDGNFLTPAEINPDPDPGDGEGPCGV